MGGTKVNVFPLLIAAIVTGILLYFLGGLFAPFLEPQTNLSKAADSVLEEAQADLGHSAIIFLTVQEGQSLHARNFDKPTRSVNFACASIDCCPFLNQCKGLYSSTEDRILVHRRTEVTLTARCLQSDTHLHICTLYMGEEPAQVVWEKATSPSSTMFETGKPLTFTGKIRNVGETPSSSLIARVEIIGTTFVSGKETETLISESEQAIENGLQPNATIDVTFDVIIEAPGTYKARMIVEGTDAGMDVKEYSLTVAGEIVTACQPDSSGSLDVSYDAFNDTCKIKRFCTGCGFAFECRDAWEEISPAQPPAFHESAESGFTYLIAPAENGTC